MIHLFVLLSYVTFVFDFNIVVLLHFQWTTISREIDVDIIGDERDSLVVIRFKNVKVKEGIRRY